MKNAIFLFFITCTFFSYSQDKDARLNAIFKDYQALTGCKQVSRKQARTFLEQEWTESFQLPKDASFKIATLKLKDERQALFVLAKKRLYIIADGDIFTYADSPLAGQPTPNQDPKDPKDPEDPEEKPKDGGTEEVNCCGKIIPDCVHPCDCSEQVPGCTGEEAELFFEMLEVRKL